MSSARRAAREAAVTILFAVDAARIEHPDEALELFRGHLRDDPEVLEALFGDDVPPDQVKGFVGRLQRLLGDEGSHWPFVERLVRGTMSNSKAIDELISKWSQNWRISRMGRVDRNILRLATYELAFEPEIPSKVTLNEAIEIAKRYGTEESGKFVNGILDRLAQELEQL